MAIILPVKKLQSLLEKKRDTYLVFSHNSSGAIRVVGIQEYLQEEKRSRPEKNEERQK
jgi:hypothetical protein